MQLSPKDILTQRTRADGEGAFRERSRYRYLGRDEGIAIVLGKYKLFVNTRDPAIAPFLMLDGFWEYWNSVFFARYVQPGWRVAEVGANLGYFTLLLADLVGPQGQVVAFEPLSVNYTLLRRSVAVNGFADRVTCRPEALSDEDGEGRIVVNPDNYGGGSILAAPGAHTISEQVKLMRSGAALGDFRPDFIKMDVEGAEEKVMAGMSDLLAAQRRIALVIEFDRHRFSDWRGWLSARAADGFAINKIDYDGEARATTIDALADHGMTEVLLERH